MNRISYKTPRNDGQLIAWVLLLFALTVIGGLPLIGEDLNLSKISQSKHLPLVLTGMLVTACAPTLASPTA